MRLIITNQSYAAVYLSGLYEKYDNYQTPFSVRNYIGGLFGLAQLSAEPRPKTQPERRLYDKALAAALRLERVINKRLPEILSEVARGHDMYAYRKRNGHIGLAPVDRFGRLTWAERNSGYYIGGGNLAFDMEAFAAALPKIDGIEWSREGEVVYATGSPLKLRAFAEVFNYNSTAYQNGVRRRFEFMLIPDSETVGTARLAFRPTARSSTRIRRDGENFVRMSALADVLRAAKSYETNSKEFLRAAYGMGKTTYEVPVKRHDTSESFLRYLGSREEHVVPAAESIELLPLPHAKSVTERTWGIEVEAAGARGVGTPTQWDRKYDGSLRSAYSTPNESRDPDDCPDHDHREYVEDEDGNEVENPDYDDPDYCSWLEFEDEYYDDDDSDTAEFVSPILRNAHSKGLQGLVEDLSAEPWNDSAGIHVHVGAEDLTPRQLGNLTFAYNLIEPIIEQAYQRRVRNYCRPRPAEDIVQVLKSAKRAKKIRHDDYRDRDVLYYGDRYHSVNLSALDAHGTVEFRAMGPRYQQAEDYDVLIKWAMFARDMVSIAKLNLHPRVWFQVRTWDDLYALLVKYGPEIRAAHNGEVYNGTQNAPEVGGTTTTERYELGVVDRRWGIYDPVLNRFASFGPSFRSLAQSVLVEVRAGRRDAESLIWEETTPDRVDYAFTPVLAG